MTRLTWTTVLLSGIALAGAAVPGCASSTAPRGKETAGEYLDDSVITTKVKAALMDEASLKSFQISVKTYRDTVQLSGFVDSAAAVHRAGQVAAGVKGVATVKNDLIVK